MEAVTERRDNGKSDQREVFDQEDLVLMNKKECEEVEQLKGADETELQPDALFYEDDPNFKIEEIDNEEEESIGEEEEDDSDAEDEEKEETERALMLAKQMKAPCDCKEEVSAASLE